MTKEAALHAFFNSFGIAGYPFTAVPNDVELPYLTYEAKTDNINGGDINITVNLWYYGTNEAPINAKARELSQEIGLGGTVRACDGGYLWFKRGTPWCQTVRDETDNNIKRRYINVDVEYLTEN